MDHPYKQVWMSLITGSMYCTLWDLSFKKLSSLPVIFMWVYAYFVVKKRFSFFNVPPYQSVHFMAYLSALSLCLHLCLTSGRAAVDIPSVKKKFKMAAFMLVKVVTHNAGRWPTIHSVIVLMKYIFLKSTHSARQDLVCNPCNRHIGKSLKNWITKITPN